MMKRISVQLHALPGELLDLLKRALPEGEFHFTFTEFKNSKFEEIAALSELKVEEMSNWSELFVTMFRPNRDAANAISFREQNRDSLVIRFGVPSAGKLEESCINTGCYDLSAYDTWQKVTRKMKRGLRLGGDVLSPYNGGVRGRSKTHYYSPQALEFSRNGGKLYLLGNQTNEFIPGELISSVH
jgi:hypothetical protein